MDADAQTQIVAHALSRTQFLGTILVL
jgi:hypothetical protein